MTEKLQIKYAGRILGRRVFAAFAMTMVVFATSQSFAQTPKPEAEAKAAAATTAEPEKAPTDWEQRAIDGNIAVSEWVDGAAEFIDLFIAGRRVTTVRNETSVRIENMSRYIEGVGYDNSTSFNINLRLPNVEEYWNLKFTSYDQERERRSTENAQYRQRTREQNYGATIGFFRQLGNVRTAFQPRIELQDPLKVSHSLSFDTTTKITDRAQFNPKVEFFAASDRGTGVYNQLNFGIQLTKIYGLALINQSTYEDKTHIFTVAQGFSISRPVTPLSGIAYSLFFNSINRTKYHLESYSLATTWTQIIYKNILDYTVTPHMDFTKEHNFTGRVGLDLNIGLKF